MCSTKAPWYSTATTRAAASPGRGPAPPRGAGARRRRRRRRCAQPGHRRDDADLAGEQRVVDVGGQEVGVAHEGRDEPGRRRLEDPLRGVGLLDEPVAHHHHPVAQVDSASVWSWVTSIAVVLVSRSAADGLGADLRAQRLVEAAERLVEQHHGRPRRERPGQRDPLLLAAGELVGVALGEVARAGPARAPRRPGGAARPRGAGRCRTRRCARRSGAGTARGPGRPGRPGGARAGCQQRRSATSSPAILIVPASGRSRPATSRSVVDLPQPEGPIRVSSSPGAASSDSRSAATTAP